jgi:hypothetical protein
MRPPTNRKRAMDEDFSTMDDPGFLAERRRVRETVEALTERLARLDDEFIRRAAAKWQEAPR